MSSNKQDSTSAVSRFGRDKRVRTASAERVDHGPRPRREADGDGYAQRGGERPHTKRASYNPNFSADNRLHEGGEYGGETSREPRGERPAHRSSFRGGRSDRGEHPAREYGAQTSHSGRSGQSSYGDRQYRGKRTSYGERPWRGGSSSFEERQHQEDAEQGFDSREPRQRGGRSFERGASSSEFGRKPYRGGSSQRSNRNDGGRGASNRDTRGEHSPKRSYRAGDRPERYPKYAPSKMPDEMRLNRFLAQSGLCSRREADDYIQAGLVTVNGVVVSELGTKVKPTDDVRFNDERIQGEKKVYLVLNKPKGYVTSMDDPHADKTVMDLVKNACTERIYPVGRLDKNSVGLLLFTNDGDVASQLTHPSLEKKKIYQVTLDKPLTRADMERIAEGVTLEDGEVYADEIAYASENKKEVGIEIHSGRNRIVRRIFEHLGYSVQKLDRVYYAGITKKNLKRGAWRFLTREEVERLKSGRYE